MTYSAELLGEVAHQIEEFASVVTFGQPAAREGTPVP
jgi:hypothetical protein